MLPSYRGSQRKTIRIKITNQGTTAIEGAELAVTAPGDLSLVSAKIAPKCVSREEDRPGNAALRCSQIP